MGELLGPLLGQLSGTGPGSAMSPVKTVPPENGLGGMTEAVMGFPSVMRGGISEAGAIPGQGALPQVTGGGMDPELEAVVRGFKPKKISFWGALGDQLLKHWGNEPAFAKRIESKNMRRAMEGFTQDPVEAVRRLSQIPGMEGKAWELFNQIQDNQRADKQFDRLYGNDQEKTLKNAAGLAGIALSHPPSRKAAIARYNQIVRARGMEDFVLADDVDDSTLAAIAGGAIPPTQQEQLELRRIRLEQTGRATESQIEHRKVTERQTDERIAQGDRAEEGRNRRAANRPKSGGKAQPRVVMTPGGNQFTIHPNGLVGTLMKPDGTTIKMIKFGNGWKIYNPKDKQ